MFLTHQDDVADHKEFSQHFPRQRNILQDDVSEDTMNCELKLGAEADVDLAPDLKVIMTPGHSIRKISNYHFEWVFPGHGGWMHGQEKVIKENLVRIH